MVLLRCLGLQLCLCTLATGCGTEIDAEGYHAMKSSFDIILDVRTWNEYLGNSDVKCNNNTKDPKKCDYGHPPEAYLLKNDAREDKASVYKVDGAYQIDTALLDALTRCFGDQISTTTLATTCHSGGRSGHMQQQLVAAGFKCEHTYNVKPGARGLYQAWEASNFANNTLALVKGEASPGAFDWTLCPADKTGPKAADSGSSSAASTNSSPSTTSPATGCGTEIDVESYHAMKSSFDIILDVRTWNEYLGNSDAKCNDNKKDPKKCDYGHPPEAFLLKNDAREDKASVYKVDGAYQIDTALLDALTRCFGDQISTTTLATTCHSGGRSGHMQQQLVAAGFKCEHTYNVKPGARGLYQAWEASNFANNTLALVKGEASPGAFDWSLCPADKSGPKAADSGSSSADANDDEGGSGASTDSSASTSSPSTSSPAEASGARYPPEFLSVLALVAIAPAMFI